MPQLEICVWISAFKTGGHQPGCRVLVAWGIPHDLTSRGGAKYGGGWIGHQRQPAVDAPRGIVRGFDVKSGTQLWSWDPVPRTSQDPAWESWKGTVPLVPGRPMPGPCFRPIQKEIWYLFDGQCQS